MAKKQQTNYNSFYSMVPTSEFDGKLGALIGRTVVAFLAFLFAAAIGAGAFYALYTVGADMGSPIDIIMLVVGGLLAFFFVVLGLAWATNIRTRWFVRHTRVNGYRLKFVGKTWNLTWTYIKWFFCSVFTLFIYALWLPIKSKQWQTKNTVIDESAPVMEMQTFYQAPQQVLPAGYDAAAYNFKR